MKRPFYDADNVEAMNIVLGKVQGPSDDSGMGGRFTT